MIDKKNMILKGVIFMKHFIAIISAILIIFQTIHVNAETPDLGIEAKSALLMEASTGEILYSVNPDEQLPIASVTKIMTMLLIMEDLDSGKITTEDMVSVSERAMSMGGSTMFLETGESLSVNDMLKGIAVASANDGCVAMAEFLSGSVESFVDRMNERAKELGMTNTNFINTNGLDADNHYSSAADVAKMSRELLKHERIFNYTTIWTDSLRDGKFDLANTNRLVRFYDGATGLKTGSTSKALCCISATAKREDMHLIAVVLGAPNSDARFSGARSLLDYGFSAYSVKKYAAAGEACEDVVIQNGVNETVKSEIRNEISKLESKNSTGEIEKRVTLAKNIKAPVYKGDYLGELVIMKDGERVGSSEIIASEDVEKKTYFMIVAEILSYMIKGN